MKKYVKPMAQVEKFTTDLNVAAPLCKTKVSVAAFTTIPEQTVSCVISTSDTVFQNQCSHSVTPHCVTAGEAGTYTPGQFVSKFGGGNYNNKGTNVTVQAGDYVWAWQDSSKRWHAGVVTVEQVPAVFDFSY